MQSVQCLARCWALRQGVPQVARGWQLPATSRFFCSGAATGSEESAAAAATPAEAGADTTPAPSKGSAIDHSVIDDAVERINLNLGLKTEVLAAHGIGMTKAMERQQSLRLGMLLAARRKAAREGREGKQYTGMLVSDALRKSMPKGA